jgi:ferredoxin, 2Fe-2S
MPTITFVEPDGTRREVFAQPGETLMAAATRANVAGIIGECGGSAMCATCHCYLVSGTLPDAEPPEADTIEFVAQNVRATSRLACQITATATMDGIVLQVAAA